MSDSVQDPFGTLHRLRQERDRALEDAAKWRRRYEVEAEQRRNEAENSDRTIRELRAELLQLSQLGAAPRPVNRQKAIAPSSESSGATLAQLTRELTLLAQERDALAEALSIEQQEHAKTRENLISALGEALQRKKP